VSRRRGYIDAAAGQAKLRDAALLIRLEADYRAGRAVAYPGRITFALDYHGLEGPSVDAACLAEEPAVDQWEAGEGAPTWEQLVALAELTGYPVPFFTKGPLPLAGPGWLCGDSGCEQVSSGPRIEPYRPSPPLARVVVLGGGADR
jgi:hypothetical protein